MSAAGLPSKRDVARALLLKGTVFVHLDPRADTVMVPAWLKRQPQLVLQVGLDMPVPIPDLRVDDTGVFATLSFNRTSFTCAVPWEAVFAVVGDDGRGMVWPGSMPSEIAAEVEREVSRGKAGADAKEDGAIDELPLRRARHASRDSAGRQQGSRSKHVTPTVAKKRLKPKPPSLELISGAGDADDAQRERAVPARRREGRALPSYLRVVK